MQMTLPLNAEHERNEIYYLHERLDKLEKMCSTMRRALFARIGEQNKRILEIEEKQRLYVQTEWTYQTGDSLFDDRRVTGT
jgi:hypothetical protein